MRVEGLPAELLEATFDRIQHIIGGILRFRVIDNLVFTLNEGLFDVRGARNHDKIGRSAAAFPGRRPGQEQMHVASTTSKTLRSDVTYRGSKFSTAGCDD